jgi:hypothetical protein
MVFEYGVIDGFWRFLGFVYVGSFVLLVAMLVVALLGRVLLKHHIAASGVIVSLYSLFELTQGNGEKVFNAAVYGVFVGSVLGAAMVFVSSSTAEKVRTTESAFYAKVKRWLRGRE